MYKIILFVLLILSSPSYSKDTAYLSTPQGGDFAISTTKNPAFQLSDLKGKTVFIFFGFTRCPNVCPMTVQRLKMLSNHLVKNNLNDAHFLFISVDNERDNQKTLDKYVQDKGKLFSAATASDDKLREIIAMYGGYFSKIRTKTNKLIVDHSSDIYVINPEGKWVDTIPYKKPFEQYLQAYEKSKKAAPVASVTPSRREMNVLGSNSTCDLGKSSCDFTLSDGEKIELTFSPYPIKTQKEFNISVKSKSTTYTPVEIDFVGVEQNMGLIRPAFKTTNNLLYTASLDLPVCERSKMRWKVRLVLKDKLSQLNLIEFFLETND